jgi:hypothetical protein
MVAICEKKIAHSAYHLVEAKDLLLCDGRVKKLAAKELNMRVEYSRKYYGNRYDQGHARWMQRLESCLDLSSKMNLSLDALCTLNKIKKIKISKTKIRTYRQ